MPNQYTGPRLYSSAWNQLKNLPEGQPLRIVAPKKFHHRIIRMISKEKDMDLIFKLQQSEQCRKARIKHSVTDSQISFTLSFSIGLGDF